MPLKIFVVKNGVRVPLRTVNLESEEEGGKSRRRKVKANFYHTGLAYTPGIAVPVEPNGGAKGKEEEVTADGFINVNVGTTTKLGLEVDAREAETTVEDILKKLVDDFRALPKSERKKKLTKAPLGMLL